MTSAYSLIAPFFPLEVSSILKTLLIMLFQAARKGSNALTTGVIVSASPFCLVIATPLCGYFVGCSSVAKCLSLDYICGTQLPKMGMKFTLISGMFLVGGAFFLMGYSYSIKIVATQLSVVSVC